ncbi:MAG TPA: PAS domain S-box protein [Candidatus Eisenbacteria bacterium]|nr:PAS domain S-box protein [Candidatus Eisenbacteria bacterium]
MQFWLLMLPALLGLGIVALLLARHRMLRREGSRVPDAGLGYIRSLMENSPEGMWRVDPRGVTTEVNRAMAEILGVPADQIVGRSFRDFLDAGNRDAAEGAFQKGLGGQPVRLETTFRRPDGGEVRMLVSTHPILDANGAFVEGFGIIRDITARHRVERERQHAISLLEAAFESTADGLLIVDLEGKIVRFNERFARMWEIPAEVLHARDDARALEFVLAQLAEPEQFLSKVRKLYATPEAESFDTLRFRDGRVFERYSLPQRIGKEIVGRVWSFRDVTERERAQEEIRQALEREATIARNLDTALFTLSVAPDGTFLRYEYVSRGAEALYGRPYEELQHDPQFWVNRVHPEDVQNIVRPAMTKLLKLQPATIEVRYESSRGIWRWHRSRLTSRHEKDGVIMIDGIETDVTDRIQLEEQLRHAQKMEAVGQLAGGVAHDFNNILTAILGYADLLLGRTPTGDRSRPALEEIRKGGERAAALTRQLLTFSRRATTQPRIVDLNAAVRDLEDMAQRLAGDSIQLVLELDDSIGYVRIDPVQLEQVLVNLVVNARDAIQGAGEIRIRTDQVRLQESDVAGDSELAPGPYARLQVSDTGTGIPFAVLEHIFEPFFTTKEPGRGTGLGLATVYGIVRQHGGRIRAINAPEGGALLEIVFPALSREGRRPEDDPDFGALPTGTETLLLVEDDPSLLTLARAALEDLGYRVLPAPRAIDALSSLEREKGRVDLLVTDVVMPEMGGRELADRARKICPGLPILFVSGYVRDPALLLDPGATVHFLEKPYTTLALARRIREALESHGRAGAPRGGAQPAAPATSRTGTRS